jgi:hypothetical protein
LGLTNEIVALLIIATIVMIVVDGLLVCELDALQEKNEKVTSKLEKLQKGIIEDYIKENTNKLNITDIVIYNCHSPGVPAYAASANVTIHNQGINDVNNLTLKIETADATYNIPIEVIHTEERNTFIQKVAWFKSSETKIVATICAGDLVLAKTKIEF